MLGLESPKEMYTFSIDKKTRSPFENQTDYPLGQTENTHLVDQENPLEKPLKL